MPGEVADASVIGALVFGEPRAAEARALLRGAEIYAPPLLSYELASIAWKKAKRYPGQKDRLIRALEIASRISVRWVEVDHVEVVVLALANRLTTYDASYLSVARTLGMRLVTFDRRLAAASRRRTQ